MTLDKAGYPNAVQRLDPALVRHGVEALREHLKEAPEMRRLAVADGLIAA